MIVTLETSQKIDDLVHQFSGHLLPAVSGTNLLLNIICVAIFSNKRLFKETAFKYFLFNSIIDSLLLFFITFKAMLTSFIDLYVYFALTSVLFTHSKLIKILFSSDKLSRMTGKLRFKYSIVALIAFIVSIGIALNVPMMLNYDMFEYLWFKISYCELIVLDINTLKGFLLGIYMILVDTFLLYKLIKINICLKISMTENKKNLIIFIKNNTAQISIQMDQNENVNTKKNRKTIEDYENERQKLCSLILINNLIYSFGWSITLIAHWFQFFVNINNGSLDVRIGYNYYAYLDLTNSLVDIILAWTMGSNFFVYFFNNNSFRFVALGKRKLLMSNCFFKPEIFKI